MFDMSNVHMKFKYSAALLVLIFFSLAGIAQDYKSSIKQRFTAYSQHMKDREFNKALDFVPEAIFTVAPRAQMVALFEQLFNNKSMEVKLISFEIKEISNSRKIDSSYYAHIRYVSVISMKMNADTTESPNTKALRISMTKAAFANKFGSDHVAIDENTETYIITTPKRSWAISTNGQDGWKFVNVEPSQRIIMEKILPKELIEESLN